MAGRQPLDVHLQELPVYDLLLIRAIFVLILATAAWFLQPFGLTSPLAAATGALLGVLIVLAEIRLKQVSLKRLIGAAVGSVLGILGAFLISLVISWALPGSRGTVSFFQLLILLVMTYVGLIVGAAKGDMLNLSALGGLFGGEKAQKQSFKILDTSVIIDGRIADICRTGFIEGTIYVPGFVLDEVQHIADSEDPLRRARGRRGLEVLRQLQQETDLEVRVHDRHAPHTGDEVDARLVRLAKAMRADIVTNDHNLNRVAELQGVRVLNINELAEAVRIHVLPGEELTVVPIREGQEADQGVAYLEDGTMVVVEGGKPYLNQAVDVVVTSVLQSTRGKMLFAEPKLSDSQTDHDYTSRTYPSGRKRRPVR